MEEKFIPQIEPLIGQEEAEAMQDYLSSGAWLTEFKKTEEFENQISKFTGSKYCVATNNGTVSLILALLVVGIGKEDEVIVPNLTMIATPNSAKLIGANPVLVDVEKETLCMDLDKARKAITIKTKCLMYVSFNGRTNDINKVKKLCKENNLVFIEDAAQSLGSFYENKHLGTFGDMGSLSFSPPKIITTGQGGAILTDDEKKYKKLKKLKNFGRAGGGNDIHESIGYNFKFTDMQAVIGIEQMKKLPDRINRKKEMFKRYYDNLREINKIEFIQTNLKQTSPWFMDIFVEDPIKLADYLKQNNIGSRPIYPPINSQKAYNLKGDFPVTDNYANRGLWLPSSLKLIDEEIDFICNKIKKFYSN